MRDELEKHSLWWHGPEFLLKDKNEWPKKEVMNSSSFDIKLEEKREHIIANIKVPEPNAIIERFSSYEKMLRVLSLCFSWRKQDYAKTSLTVEELLRTEKRLIKIVQKEMFEAEILSLQKQQHINTKSVLYNLSPYLDSENILRVGGRIQKSTLSTEEKFPIILPSKHHFTKILVRHAHIQTLHGGMALVSQNLRQKFWIINACRTIKSVLHKCTICFRFKKKLLTQKMGNLRSYRLQ